MNYKSKTNIFIGIAFILGIIVTQLLRGPLYIVGILVDIILWIVGCSYYAQYKGYSKYFGYFGVFPLLGLLVLIALPNKTTSKDQYSSSKRV